MCNALQPTNNLSTLRASTQRQARIHLEECPLKSNPKEFEQCFRRWVTSLVEKLGVEVVAIDGKNHRGSIDRESKLKAHRILRMLRRRIAKEVLRGKLPPQTLRLNSLERETNPAKLASIRKRFYFTSVSF